MPESYCQYLVMSYPFTSYDVCWSARQLRPCQTNQTNPCVESQRHCPGDLRHCGQELNCRCEDRSSRPRSIPGKIRYSSHMILGQHGKAVRLCFKILAFSDKTA